MVKTFSIPELSEKDREKFWSQVNRKSDSECWNWTGYKISEGYGYMKISGHAYRVHRISWRIFNGQIPVGKLICHDCDNPSCVNPNHLKCETQKWNMQDRDSKGRANRAIGERHWNAKLSSEKAAEIKGKYATGRYFQWELGNEYGVNSRHISRIFTGKRWKNITVKEAAYE